MGWWLLAAGVLFVACYLATAARMTQHLFPVRSSLPLERFLALTPALLVLCLTASGRAALPRAFPAAVPKHLRAASRQPASGNRLCDSPRRSRLHTNRLRLPLRGRLPTRPARRLPDAPHARHAHTSDLPCRAGHPHLLRVPQLRRTSLTLAPHAERRQRRPALLVIHVSQAATTASAPGLRFSWPCGSAWLLERSDAAVGKWGDQG